VNWYFQIVTHLPDDPKYSIQTTDNPVEQEERFRRDEEFLSFHQTTEEKIQRAFDELCPAVPNMNSSDEQKPGRESVAITNHLLYSIIHQKFFNAFLLCKLEQMRILYWPFEDDKREDTSPEELLLLIIFRSSQNKYRGNDDIANGPLGACINHITQSQFLDVTTTVDWLMAYISEMSLADNAPPKQRYVSLIRNLFSAIERFQS